MKKVQTLTIAAISGLMAFTQLQAQPVNQNKEACPQMHMKCKHQADGNGMINRMVCKRIRHIREMMMKIMEKLDLSADQKAKIQSIKKEHFMQIKNMRKAGKGEYRLGQFITQNGFDKSGFIKMSEKRAQIRVVNRAEHIEKMISVLTPEQRMELKILLKKERKNKL